MKLIISDVPMPKPPGFDSVYMDNVTGVADPYLYYMKHISKLNKSLVKHYRKATS